MSSIDIRQLSLINTTSVITSFPLMLQLAMMFVYNMTITRVLLTEVRYGSLPGLIGLIQLERVPCSTLVANIEMKQTSFCSYHVL